MFTHVYIPLCTHTPAHHPFEATCIRLHVHGFTPCRKHPYMPVRIPLYVAVSGWLMINLVWRSGNSRAYAAFSGAVQTLLDVSIDFIATQGFCIPRFGFSFG